MEIIEIKHKKYEILQIISEDCFKCQRNEKLFFIRKYEPYSDDGQMMAYEMKKLSNSGIKIPKLYCIDKRKGYIVNEFIDGENLMNILSQKDLDETVYEQLFKNAYMAKVNKMTLNYEPDKWMLKDGVLYYTYALYIKYDEKKDLALKHLALYFNTEELAKFMKFKGVFYDKTRIKSTYDTNKQMVLITCKYYK